MRRIFLPLLLASIAACSSREAPDKAVTAAQAQDLSLAGRSSAFVDTVAPYGRIESAPALGAAGPVRRTSVARRSTSSRSSVSTGRASSTSSASSAPAREPVTVVEKPTRRDAAIGAAAGRDLPGGLAIALPAGAQNVAPGAPVPHVIVVSLVERPGTMPFAFKPSNFTAQRGDTLRFVQASATMHNVRFKTQPKGAKLGAAAISPYLTTKGQTYTLVVDSRFSEGKYELVCDPHEAIGMHAFLTVRGGTAGASANRE